LTLNYGDRSSLASAIKTTRTSTSSMETRRRRPRRTTSPPLFLLEQRATAARRNHHRHRGPRQRPWSRRLHRSGPRCTIRRWACVQCRARPSGWSWIYANGLVWPVVYKSAADRRRVGWVRLVLERVALLIGPLSLCDQASVSCARSSPPVQHRTGSIVPWQWCTCRCGRSLLSMARVRTGLGFQCGLSWWRWVTAGRGIKEVHDRSNATVLILDRDIRDRVIKRGTAMMPLPAGLGLCCCVK